MGHNGAMNDYLILGAGAVGSVVGGRLGLAGQRVQLINRSAETAKAIAAQGGLRLGLDDGDVLAPVLAATPDQAQAARHVLLLTKTPQSEAAVRAVAPLMGPDTVWITLQNGLGNGQRLAQWPGDAARVVHGVTMLPADLRAPGDVASHGKSTTWLGPLQARDAACSEAVARDLAAAGIDAHHVLGVQNNIWQKAVFNCAMNGLCALTQGGPGLMADWPDGRALAHELVDEVGAVALAAGAQVDLEAVHALVDMGMAHHRYHKPSMLQDVLAQRLTEIDALNGFVHEQAQRLGLAAPKNHMILRLVRLRERAPEFWAAQTH